MEGRREARHDGRRRPRVAGKLLQPEGDALAILSNNSVAMAYAIDAALVTPSASSR